MNKSFIFKNNHQFNFCQEEVLKNLEFVLNQIFENFQLEQREFVEVVYDIEGNKHYSLAKHFKSFQEIVKFLSEQKTVNIVFCPALRKPSVDKINRRTGDEYVSRTRALIFDVEDKIWHRENKEKPIDPALVQTLLNDTLQELPELFQKATYLYTAYTGGGGQICFLLDRWTDRQEAETLFQLLSEYIKNQQAQGRLRYIDIGALKPAQPLRLITTKNISRNVDTFFFEINENAETLKVDELMSFLAEWANQKLNEQRAKKVEEEQKKSKGKGKVENPDKIKEIVNFIKEKISFQEIIEFSEIKDKGKYYIVFCPFHSETHPSFVIYRNTNGELAIDFHDGEKYDVISFYQKIKKVNFYTALQELILLTGKQIEIKDELFEKLGAKEKLYEQVRQLQEYLWDALNIEKVLFTTENSVTIYEIHTKHKTQKDVTFTIQAEHMLDSNTFGKVFSKKYANATGKTAEIREIHDIIHTMPKKFKNEAFRMLWKHILTKIEEIAEDATHESIDIMIYDEFIEAIRESQATNNFEEFEKDKGKFVKFIDEDGSVYIKAKALYKYIQSSSPLKHIFTERKLYNMLKQMGAKMERINKGKRPRVWRLPDNCNWLSLSEEKIEKILPELNFEQPQVQEQVLKVKKEIQEIKQEINEIEKEVLNENKGNEESNETGYNGTGPNGPNNNGNGHNDFSFNFDDDDLEFYGSSEMTPEQKLAEYLPNTDKAPQWYKDYMAELERECKAIENMTFEDEVPF